MKKKEKLPEMPATDDPHAGEKETHFLVKFLLIVVIIGLVTYVAYTTGFIGKIIGFFKG